MAMKRLLLGSVAVAALSSTALAVEIGPVFEALPPAEVAPYNWTGPYGRLNTLTNYESLMLAAPLTGSSADGFIGSAQFGYNYQTGPVVLGIEGDMATRPGLTGAFGAHALDAINFGTEHGWIGTLRPRAGVAADNWLFYGTGGLAYATTNAEAGTPAGSSRTGWTVGGGLEFDSGKQWSLGLEYLYANFGKQSQNPPAAALGGIEDRSQVVRGRLNYRFGWDGFVK